MLPAYSDHNNALKNLITCLSALLLCLLLPTQALSLPATLTHQGRIMESDNSPMAGVSNVTFSIYTVPTEGSAVWTETSSVVFDNGYYSLLLGTQNDFPEDLFYEEALYLGITVEGLSEFLPRNQMASVPYAISAGSVNGEVQAVGGLWVDGTEIIDSQGNLNVSGEITSDSGLNADLLEGNNADHFATSTDLTGHLEDFNNPHQVTSEQVGLGSDSSPEFSGLTIDTDTLHINSDTHMVGIGTTEIYSKLDVNGGIKIGEDTDECSSEKAGTIRWNGSNFEGCNGTAWGVLSGSGSGEGCGQDINNAGPSCLDIMIACNPEDGLYWLDPNGGNPNDAFEAYCDMSNGGWTLIWKTAQNATFGYTSDYWTTNNVLAADDVNLNVGTSKFQGFNTLSLTSIKVCVTSPNTNCFSHTFSAPLSSALALFSGSWLNESITTSNYAEFNSVFESTQHRDCPPGQKPGFNVEGGENTRARWGLSSNHPSQACQNGASEDADGAIGIGLRDHTSQQASAGYTDQHIQLGNNAPSFKNAWLWIK